MEILLFVEKRENERGSYYVMYYYFDKYKVYLKPLNYQFNNYCLYNMEQKEKEKGYK